MMPLVNVNNVKEVPCPHCSKMRPVDWFVGDSDACWRCRELNRDLRHNLLRGDDSEAKRRKLKSARGKI